MKNMQPGQTRVNPLKEEALFMSLLRKLIFRVAPYTGVVSVKFLGTVSPTEPGPLRFSSAEAQIPKGGVTRFESINDPGAGESLLSFLVSFYQDMLDCDKDIVVALHEADDRDPLCGTFGDRDIYLEFGGVGASDYMPQ